MAKDLSEIKKSGFIPQRQKNRFSLLIKITVGTLSAENLSAVSKLATEFGKGQVHITSRQSIEIPFVKLSDIEQVRKALDDFSLEPGCIGPGIRTMTACQGKSICSHGLIDTLGLAVAIDKKFSQKILPHKFKISVTGCANNCLKVEGNDIGIKGAISPRWTQDNCVYCGLCAKACRSGAISVQNKTLTYAKEKCVSCGRCVRACPKACWTGEQGALIYFGGVFGNKIQIGRPLLPVLTDRAAILKAIRATLNFFTEHGRKGERFGFALNRLGWDIFSEYLAVRHAAGEF
jgi:dissimilatory sulfite reductase (desulfoviridin) alpha/beta subunit